MGPAVRVLLDQPLDGEQIDELAAWLADTAEQVHTDPDEALGWRLYGLAAVEPPPSGTNSDTSTDCRVDVVIADQITGGGDPDRDRRVQAALGYLPAQHIWICAGCNQRADHRAIGTLASAVAERYHAVIDLLGPLTPPDLPWRDWHVNRRLVDDPDQRTEGALTAISAYVTAMPGTVHEMYYDIDERQIWVSHLVDATFLRAWLRHPHFHMIK